MFFLLPLLVAGGQNALAGDLLKNSSFEKGKTNWFSLTGPDKPYWKAFTVTEDVVHNGRRAASLHLSSKKYDRDVRIVGAVQEIEKPLSFPRRLSGWYRIDNWVQGTAKQYLQVVITVDGAKNVQLMNNLPVQLSYILSGIKSPPLTFYNRKFDLTESKERQQSRWVYFNKDLHADFIKHWGAVPESTEKIRVLFEVRFDDRLQGEDNVNADVYYDDLYLGD